MNLLRRAGSTSAGTPLHLRTFGFASLALALSHCGTPAALPVAAAPLLTCPKNVGLAPAATTVAAPAVEAVPSSPPNQPVLSLPELRLRFVERIVAGLKARSADQLGALFAADAVVEVVGLSKIQSRERIGQNFNDWFVQYPTLTTDAEQVWVSDHTVAVAWSQNASTLAGGQATEPEQLGRRGLSLFRLDDAGLVVSERRYTDLGTSSAALSGNKTRVAEQGRTSASTVIESRPNDPAESLKTQALEYFSYERGKTEARLADDVRYDGLLQANTIRGKAQVASAIERFSGAFGDVRIATKQVFAAGDYLIMEHSFGGRHRVHIGSVKPSGKSVQLDAVSVFLFRDRKLARLWTYQNSATMMVQLGLLKVEPVLPKP
jgi:steroid delta-isomerase-like uncharacterized protein